MSLNLAGPGFSTEIDARPESIIVSSGVSEHLGFCFADFQYGASGKASVAVEGFQIGACLDPRGVTVGRGNERVRLGRDAVVVRRPGSSSLSEWVDGFRGQFLFFAPEAIERFFERPMSRISFEADDLVKDATEKPVVLHLLAAITHDLTANSPGGPMVMESLSAAALRSFVRSPADTGRTIRGLSGQQAKAIRDLIMERSAEALSLADLAGAVGLSVGHMLRAFKFTFGVTPYQYLIRERVECAARLLKTTPMSLEEVARESGFLTRAQMTRTFRSVLGVLPKDLR